MKILFICRHNCFRSRVAEEYLKKKEIHEVDSAGIISAKLGPTQLQIDVARNEYGLDITNKSKGLSLELINQQDIVINTADDVDDKFLTHPEYNKHKVISWKISDVIGEFSEQDVKNIIDEIISNCEAFCNEYPANDGMDL